MKQTFTGSIYLIINLVNNKKYVGQTTKKVESRFKQHCTKSSSCIKLRNAIQKYGKENFKIITLKVFACSDFETLHKQLDYWETWYIEYYHSVEQGYNCSGGGQFSIAVSQETREKLRKAMTGKTHSEEWNKKIAVSHKGIKPSDETRKKLSKIHKGKILFSIRKPVDQFDLDGNFIKHWDCISDARKFFGVDNSHISAVCKGKRESAYGYKWKYSLI